MREKEQIVLKNVDYLKEKSKLQRLSKVCIDMSPTFISGCNTKFTRRKLL